MAAEIDLRKYRKLVRKTLRKVATMPNPRGINQYSKGGSGAKKKRKGAPKLKSSMKGDPFKPQGADARKPQGRRI